MTVRQELEIAVHSWVNECMHKALKIDKPAASELDAFFLCEGFVSRMDVIQKVEVDTMHCVLLDMSMAGSIDGETEYYEADIFFNAREPDYTDAVLLSDAYDRSLIMAQGFIRDMRKLKKECRHGNNSHIAYYMNLATLSWSTEGVFGDGWASTSLHLVIAKPTNLCL